MHELNEKPYRVVLVLVLILGQPTMLFDILLFTFYFI